MEKVILKKANAKSVNSEDFTKLNSIEKFVENVSLKQIIGGDYLPVGGTNKPKY